MITLAFVTNRRYLPGLRLALASMLLSGEEGDSFDLWVFHSDLSSRDSRALQAIVKRFSARASLRFQTISEADFSVFNPQITGSFIAYTKLVLPDFIPSRFFAFVDSDMLVMRSFRPLFEDVKGGSVLAGSMDRQLPTLADDCPWELTEDEKKLPYLNTGFIVYDQQAWAKTKMKEKLRHLTVDGCPKLGLHDQTILNYAARGQVQVIPLGWNRHFLPIFCQGHLNDLATEIAEEGRNFHFVANPKPWLTAEPTPNSLVWWAASEEIFGRFRSLLYRLEACRADRKFARDYFLRLAARGLLGLGIDLTRGAPPQNQGSLWGRLRVIAQKFAEERANSAALDVIVRKVRQHFRARRTSH